MAPRWVTKVSACLFLVGLFGLAVGPVVLARLLPPDPDAAPLLAPPDRDDAEAFKAFEEERMAIVQERFGVLIWLFPLAGAMLFTGAIGLLLAWVSRPLGSDLDPSRAESAEADAESEPSADAHAGSS